MRIRATVVAIAVAATLGACGGSDGGQAADSSDPTGGSEETSKRAGEKSPSEEESAMPSVERAAFCDAVDAQLVETALGGPSQWLEQRKPGDTFEIFPGQKEKSDRFYCRWQTNKESEDYGPGDATFVLAIPGKPATQPDVKKELDQARASGKEFGCEELELDFGDPSYAKLCEQKQDQYNQASANGTALGVFGEALLICYVQRVGKGVAGEVQSALEEVCGQVPAALSS